MKTHLLFPKNFRYLGYLLTVPGFILGYTWLYGSPIGNYLYSFLHQFGDGTWRDWLNEVTLTLVILGLLFIAFSKIKREDELTSRIRMHALYWAVLANSAIFILIYAFVIFCEVLGIKVPHEYVFIVSLGPSYIYYFSIYNLFTPLVVFIIVFYYLLFSKKNEFVIKPPRYLPYKPFNFLGKFLTIIVLALGLIGLKFQSLEYALLFLPIPVLMWAYSKKKNEDEFTEMLRLEAMQIAVYINYAIVLVANFTLYETAFLTFQYINLITLPVISVFWFQYRLYQTNKQAVV